MKKIGLIIAAIAAAFTFSACGNINGVVTDKDYDRGDNEYELEVRTDYGDYIELDVDRNTYESHDVGSSISVPRYGSED